MRYRCFRFAAILTPSFTNLHVFFNDFRDLSPLEDATFAHSRAKSALFVQKKTPQRGLFKPLVGIWQTLKDDPETVKRWYRERWQELQDGEKTAQYEKIKTRYSAGANAAHLLFLSRSAYGGVMRFRRRDGYMSTPCGVHKPIHFGTFGRRVDEWGQRIKGTVFSHREYEESLDRA